jgi:Peptidase family S41
MKLSNLIYILLLNIFFSACAVSKNAVYSPQKKIALQQLKEDVQVMEETLRNNHPSLTWYTTEDTINASFQRASNLLKDSMNEIEFRNLLSETIFPIRCGHTSVRFSTNYYKYIRKHREAGFPLGLKIINDSSLVVTTNLFRKDSVIKTGTVIQSINGMSSKKIIDSMLPLISVDGYSKNFSYQNLSNSFSTYYNNRFGVQKNYTIEFLNPQGEIQKKILNKFNPLKDTADRRPFVVDPLRITQQQISRHQLQLQRIRSFQIDSTNSYATLRLNSFGPGLRRHYLRKTFRELKKKKIDQLVIDVRNNGGGIIKTSMFLTRLIKHKPFVFADSIYSTHRKIRSSVKVYKKIIYNLGLLFLTKKVSDSQFHFRYFNTKTVKPAKNNFNGQVYILTGGFSFSATTLFAAAVKGQENVSIVGEETGGGFYGNNGVFITEMVLPHSKLRVRVPLFRIVNNIHYPKNGRGVLPDIEVKPNAETIRLNKDPKMEKVIELIMQRKNK